MLRFPLLPPIVAALALAVAGLAAHAFNGGRAYHNEAMRIRSFLVPPKEHGWELAPQIGYPRILVLATATDGSRLTLGVQRVLSGTAAVTLAADARAVLQRQRLGDPRITPEADDRVRLDATLDQGRKVLRQTYLVEGDLAFVVTLVAPSSRQARALKDFEDAVRSLSIEPFATFTPPDAGATNETPPTDGG